MQTGVPTGPDPFPNSRPPIALHLNGGWERGWGAGVCAERRAWAARGRRSRRRGRSDMHNVGIGVVGAGIPTLNIHVMGNVGMTAASRRRPTLTMPAGTPTPYLPAVRRRRRPDDGRVGERRQRGAPLLQRRRGGDAVARADGGDRPALGPLGEGVGEALGGLGAGARRAVGDGPQTPRRGIPASSSAASRRRRARSRPRGRARAGRSGRGRPGGGRRATRCPP